MVSELLGQTLTDQVTLGVPPSSFVFVDESVKMKEVEHERTRRNIFVEGNCKHHNIDCKGSNLI